MRVQMELVSIHKRLWRLVQLEPWGYDSQRFWCVTKHTRNSTRSQAIILPNPVRLQVATPKV